MPKQIADESGSYSKEVDYNYDYVEDFQDLFHDNGPKILSDGREQTKQKGFPNQESKGDQALFLYSFNCVTLSDTQH